MYQPPRIVVDARVLRGQPGGVATYTEALVTRLPRLLPDVQFAFIRHSTMKAPLSTCSNVVEWTLGGDPNDPISYLFRGAAISHKFGPDDVFHAPYRILPLGAPKRSVITMHDAMQVVCPELVFPNPWTQSIQHLYWSFTVRSSLRRAGRVLAVSHHSALDTMRIEPGVRERLRETLLAVDDKFREEVPGQAIEASAAIVPFDRKFFLVLGGGYANKNHIAAVLAFARTFRREDNAYLLLIQRERTLSAEIRQSLEKYNVADRVFVHGGISTDLLRALYQRAVAFVFPSLYEGFGLPVLEAMASGCAVLATNLTSVPEVAGDAALLCDPRNIEVLGQKMRQLFEDEALRQELQRKGRERAGKFSWETTVRQTITAYREIAPWIPAAVDEKHAIC